MPTFREVDLIEVTVQCGCSRTMRPDTYAGPGRYRCSCGARVALAGLPKQDDRHCSLIRANGRACNGPKPPDDLTCQPCAVLIAKLSLRRREVVEQLAESLASAEFHDKYDLYLTLFREQQDNRLAQTRRRLDANKVSVVYYCIIRPGVVKIGTTVSLAERMAAFRRLPGDVLAVEPGSYKLESARHRQFDHLRAEPGRREDFTLTDELQSHIDAVRQKFGEPWDLVRQIYDEQQRELAKAQAES